MPIREYAAIDPKKSCVYCKDGFDVVEGINTPSKDVCPNCGTKIQRQLSAPNLGRSESGLHDRAKSAGFTTYKKSGKGEYEKKY